MRVPCVSARQLHLELDHVNPNRHNLAYSCGACDIALDQQARCSRVGPLFLVLPMPFAPPRPCRHPGCVKLVRQSGGYCDEHRKSSPERQQDRERGSAAQRGYGSKWRTSAAQYLQANPLCVRCQARGLVRLATDVDHIVPHRLGEALDSEDPDRIALAQSLFWRRSNWQSLCKVCHSRKTATEDGGFGRPRGGGGAKV